MELSVDYKIRNIEETERARRELKRRQLENRQQGEKDRQSGTVNVSSTFAAGGRGRGAVMASRGMGAGRGVGVAGRGGADGRGGGDKRRRDQSSATDELAMARFKRRFVVKY